MEAIQQVLSQASEAIKDLHLEKDLHNIQIVVTDALKNFDHAKLHTNLTKNKTVDQVFFAIAAATACSYIIRTARKHGGFAPLYVVLMTLVAVFSGDTLLSILTGAKPVFLTNPLIAPQTAIIAVLLLAGLHHFYSFFLFRIILESIVVLNMINALMTGYAAGQKAYSNVTAAILLAVIRSSASSIVAESQPLLWGERPNHFTLHVAKLSLFLSCAYALAITQFQMKVSQIYPILCIIGLVWVLLKNILGSFNYWFLPEGILRLLTNYVPSDYPASASPKPTAAPAEVHHEKPAQQVAAKPPKQQGNKKKTN